jgi:hypothetical protein
MRQPAFRILVAVVLIGGCVQPAGAGQQPSQRPSPPAGKWEIEVFGGFGRSSNPTGGSKTALPPNDPLVLPNLAPSEYVPSWFFGSGPTIFNGVANDLELAAQRKVLGTLDPALIAPGLTRGTSGQWGVRVSRRLSPMLAVEGDVSYSSGATAISPAALSTADATRGGYADAWNTMLATAPATYQSVSTTVSQQISSPAGGRIAVSGALVIGPAGSESSHLAPYVVVGGGVVTQRSGAASIALTGNYQFQLFGTVPFNEADAVALRFEPTEHEPVFVAGGGAKWCVTKRGGIRVDGRVLIGPDRETVSIDAHPSFVPGAPPFVRLQAGLLSTPPLLFSNTPAVRTSLSGGPFDGVQTFRSNSVRVDFALSVGWFVRF